MLSDSRDSNSQACDARPNPVVIPIVAAETDSLPSQNVQTPAQLCALFSLPASSSSPNVGMLLSMGAGWATQENRQSGRLLIPHSSMQLSCVTRVPPQSYACQLNMRIGKMGMPQNRS